MEPHEAEYLEFCPRLRELLRTGRTRTEDGGEIRVEGASTFNNLHVIRECLLEQRPSRTLEIGLAHGASALAILATLQSTGVSDFHHTAIDPFQHRLFKGSACRLLREAGFADHFRLLEEPSAIALAGLARAGESFDFVYVDGSHLFEDVFVDLYYAAGLLREGGLVLLDDCRDPHVAKVIRFLHSNYAGILAPVATSSWENPRKGALKRFANYLGYRQIRAFRKVGETPRPWNAPFRRF